MRENDRHHIIEEMEQQRIRLGKEAEQLETDEKISSISGSTAFSMAVEMALTIAETAFQFIKQIAEGLQSIARIINALEMLWGEDDPIYGNNYVDPSILEMLSGHANHGAMWGVHNVFADVDGSLASSRIQDASKVAGMVGFDVGSLNQVKRKSCWKKRSGSRKKRRKNRENRQKRKKQNEKRKKTGISGNG